MKSKTLQIINSLFEQVDPTQVDPSQVGQDENIAPDATAAQDTQDIPTEVTANQIVNLATLMRDFIVNASQFGSKLEPAEVARLSAVQITPENAMKNIEDFSRLVSGKQPDMGVNIQSV